MKKKHCIWHLIWQSVSTKWWCIDMLQSCTTKHHSQHNSKWWWNYCFKFSKKEEEKRVEIRKKSSLMDGIDHTEHSKHDHDPLKWWTRMAQLLEYSSFCFIHIMAFLFCILHTTCFLFNDKTSIKQPNVSLIIRKLSCVCVEDKLQLK